MDIDKRMNDLTKFKESLTNSYQKKQYIKME